MEFCNDYTIVIPPPSRKSNKIIIPKGVKTIPQCHYEDCDQLQFIYIPDSVEHIGDYAFKGCTNLKMVYIPEGVSTIGVGCFCDCVKMIMLHIPNSVYQIKQQAFLGCKSLVSVTLPARLHYIPDFCFFKCKMLDRLIIPPSVTSIGESAFGKCTNLTEIDLPNNILRINSNSFKDCFNLKKIFLGQLTYQDSRIPVLGTTAFMTCESLVEINLSCYHIYTLKASCFEQCKSLERVILSKKTRHLTRTCFVSCPSLKYISYESELKSTNNNVSEFGLDLEHIQWIPSLAFADCTSLESVRLHNKQYVEFGCFNGCKSLKKISLPLYLDVETGIDDKKQTDFFPSDKIQMLILPSKATNFSYSIIYFVMYKLTQRNPILLTKQFTTENLYPFELAITKLTTRYQNEEQPDELCIVNVLYHYLRNDPAVIVKMKRCTGNSTP